MSFGALIEKFRAVALDRVEQMNVLLVQLEHEPGDEAVVEELLREVHTLKGEAKMMGFADVNLVAHQTEHLLVLATERQFQVSQQVVDTAFEGFDIVRQLLTKSAGSTDPPVDLSNFVDRVTRARQLDLAVSATAKSAAVDDYNTVGAEAAAPSQDFRALADSLSEDNWSEGSEFDGGQPTQGAQSSPQLADKAGESAAGLAEISDHHTEVRSTRTRIDGSQTLAGGSSAAELGAEPSALGASGTSDRLLRLQVGQSLRVDLEKLERLGDVAGEVLLLSRRINYGLGGLTDIRENFRRWVQRLEGRLPGQTVGELRNLMHRFDDFNSAAREELYLIGSRTAQLDQEVRGLRHVPLAQVMSHYPRAVRDLAREQGKRVRLVHTFGDVEVDRVLLSALSEPLLHLIRNAVDHGVELPEERAARGKEREALIRLIAEYVGDSIRVIIEDDGRGIDPKVLREKAVERGLITAQRARNLLDKEALALIFEPGFSTREEVSDISGRGIGMDVVRRHITDIGGYIEVESEVGQGTQITITLPASSAVSQVLIVEVAGRNFALSAKQVLRVEAVNLDEIVISHGGVFTEIDGDMVALRDWTSLLSTGGAGARQAEPRAAMTVLLLRRGRRRVAVWVDRVIGEREAMSRPFGEFLRGIKFCRGVALTDAGEVVPLLNISELLASADRSARLLLGTERAAEAKRSAEGTTVKPSKKTRVHSASQPGVVSEQMGVEEESFSFPEIPLPPEESGLSTTSSAFVDTVDALRQTVLVVEDSEITRDLLTGMLTRHGYRVQVAADGAEGWQKLQEQPVDLILTDIQMPRLDGLQLLQRVRESQRFANLPVVILTTLGAPADKARAMRLGADGYLVKLNFQERDLLDMVRRQA